ncbi:hypothetical protein C453_12906 [Haloferax elongans ATCC BAA-1513]|uniref:Uncharacterized protein n=1 Tax=Haloferax elongans ATCC BAA-1513 TaxID=1230453 RepID=M0HIX6_HALEO|nr:hypothetical protein [Haloferax elongans]ELZ84446.1 hypothetical protein C453_12906 [Haloferax elongans ATCC BAA-1513]
MTPLAFHIAARFVRDSASAGTTADQKARFGRYVNEQPAFARSQYMPDLVRDNIVDVVRLEFALTPPETPTEHDPIRKHAYQEFWLDALGSEPWDIYSISEDMADRFDLNPGWAFKTARQHLNQLVLQARMRGYRQQRLAGRRFRWGGPDPDHPACAWIRDQIPDEGLPYHEVVDLMQEAKRRFVEDPPASTHVVHDWCRHELREVQ